MAENNSPMVKNEIEIEGYLKENELAQTVVNGVNVISGLITIATSDNADYRLRFYASQYSKNDTAHERVLRSYTQLEKILPDKTISIATLLKNNPNATYEQVKLQATPMWARGSFDVYDRKEENGETVTTVSVRGQNAGAKTITATNPFVLKANYTISGYVDSISEEFKQGEPTGRKKMVISIPDMYNEVTIPVDLIAGSPAGLAAVEHYEVGMQGLFKGHLVNTREKVAKPGGAVLFLDGSQEEETTTVFVNERALDTATNPVEDPSPYFIPTDMIKKFKINRQKKLDELVYTPRENRGNNNGAPATSGSGVQAPSAASQAAAKGFQL